MSLEVNSGLPQIVVGWSK